jgi:hypothetical protein
VKLIKKKKTDCAGPREVLDAMAKTKTVTRVGTQTRLIKLEGSKYYSVLNIATHFI